MTRAQEHLRWIMLAIAAINPLVAATARKPAMVPCQAFTRKHARRMMARAGIKRRQGCVAISEQEVYRATGESLDAIQARKLVLKLKKGGPQ